jgi:hypothetical protein
MWPRRHEFSLCPLGGILKTNVTSLNISKACFTRESSGSPMLLLTVEGPRCPLAGARCVALRCYAEECVFFLSTQAQDHVWDLAEYKWVEPAHCPTDATSGGAGYERKLLWVYHPHCFVIRTQFVLCMTGVLELDLHVSFPPALGRVLAQFSLAQPSRLFLLPAPAAYRARLLELAFAYRSLAFYRASRKKNHLL